MLFDLFADPVGVTLGEAYIGYEENARVYVGSVAENRVDIRSPRMFPCSEIGHADTHLAFTELKDRTAHKGFDDVGRTGADLACT